MKETVLWKMMVVVTAVLFPAAVFAYKPPSDSKKDQILEQAYSIQVPFIENMGQIESKDVSFYAKVFGGTIFVEKDGCLTYNLFAKDKKGVIIKETFSDNALEIKGLEPSPTRVHFFRGRNKGNWKKNIPTYDSIALENICNGINLTLRAHANNVEKLFTVLPEKHPGLIRIKVTGANGLKVNEKGELELITELGSLRFTKPFAYQNIGGKKKVVEVAYVVHERATYGFNVGNYDRKRPLIIDPLLASTFIGGGGMESGISIALDSSGGVYVTGPTNSFDYPTTSGAYDESWNGGDYDVFVSKLDSTLSSLLASTFIGGTFDDNGRSVAIDGSGDVYVTGWTTSPDYPTTSGAYDESFNGYTDVFLSKLDSNLSSLLASTFIGGGSFDYVRFLAIDATGDVCVTGDTKSSDYPTTSGAYDESYSFAYDVFVSKLDSNLSSLLASTFIGGDGRDYGRSIAIDESGNLYVLGDVDSMNYPTTLGAYDETFNGGQELVVSKLDSTLSSLLASTFIGGSTTDSAYSIAIDGGGNIYVTGLTFSSDYPTTSGAYDESFNGFRDVFVSKLDSTLSSLLASTFIGGGVGTSIVLDGGGDVYISGNGSADYPTTSEAYDESHNGDRDVFVSRLDRDLSQGLSQGLVADFTADTTSGDNPLVVTFTDLSTPTLEIDTWEWDFDNDGTADSVDQSPAPWTYTEAGAYAVSLTVTGPNGSDTETKTDYIQVYENRPPELDPIGNKTVDEGQLLEFTVTASDPDNDGLDYSASNLPNGASFDTETQTFSWTPDVGQAGSYPGVVFTATDDGIPLLNDSETITITVWVIGAYTFYVPDDFATIQEAISDASVIDGGTIVVRDGIYNELINYEGKAITVQSENGPFLTTIDGGGGAPGPVVAFWNGEGADSVLDGFTITNGYGMFGGGISAMENSPTILDCIITGNEAQNGGGIFDYGEDGATITDCIISNNTAFAHGGGVYTISAKATNCTIRDNVAAGAGGGISFGFGGSYPSLAVIANCLISHNAAGTVGGGIRCDDLSPTIVHCTVSNNSATSNGGGIYCSGSDEPTVVNSIFWGDTAGGSSNEIYAGTIDITYSNIEGGYTGTGNIDSDPLFVDPGYGDFHLESSSPCINAGNNSAVPPGLTTDFEGDGRIFDNAVVDMGVDEFDPMVLRANFSGHPTSGSLPLTVQLTDHSTGSPTVWSWDFDNDGTQDSSEQYPSFTYTNGETFTVSLTVTGGVENTITKTDYITVTIPTTAAFTADVFSGTAPLTVQFTDQSTELVTDWSWDFGDGGTSTQQNPLHTYTDADEFTVSLTVTGPGGSNAEVKQNYIHVNENRAPVLGPIGHKTVDEGQLLQFTITASDPDEDSLTYSASNLPTGASFNPDTQTFSWTPGSGEAGSYPNVLFTVTDDGDPPLDGFEAITIVVDEETTLCECNMVPDTIPTVIHRGQPLGFQATITNNTENSGAVYFATKVTLPSQEKTRYIFGPIKVRLGPYQSKYGHKSHTIPASAQLGSYIYHGYVGLPGVGLFDECQFEFIVTE